MDEDLYASRLNALAFPNRDTRFVISVDFPAPEWPVIAMTNVDVVISFYAHRLISIGKVHHNRIARPNQIFRRDHDLFAPLTSTCAEDGFIDETCLEEGSESRRLPAKGWDGADHISCCFFYNFRISHLNVARANRFFEIPRNGILITAQHHKDALARLHLADQ